MDRRSLIRSVRLDPGRVEDPGAFPFAVPAVAALRDEVAVHPEAAFLVGENGSGKSTILEALADKLGLDAEGGDTVMTFVERRADSPLPRGAFLEAPERSLRSLFA
jgi:predicted ATPase